MDALRWIETSGAAKLLITDNVNNGNRLVKRLNRKGRAVSSLTVSTSARIAKELLIHDFASAGDFRRIREVADDVGAFILEGILRADPERYSFVPQASLCTATAAEILSNLNLIRENQMTDAYKISYKISVDPRVPQLNQVDADKIPVGLSVDSKILQLNQLIRDYEKRLAELGFYDHCTLLKAGLKILSGNAGLQAAGPVGLLFTDRVSVLEERFLNAYAPEAVRLFIGKPEEEPSWHFYKSYGIWNEAEYILEDIRARQIPFGQVRIVYTSQDYEPALQAAFGERRVPVRFTSGRPVSGKDSIRMLLSLIQWASNGYRYEDLKSIVLNPLFVIPVQEGEKPVNSAREFLKGIEDGIGWGLDRYKKFLKESEKEKEEEKEKEKEKKAFHTNAYLQFIKDVVSVFDGIREPVDAAALFGVMIAFAKKYSRRTEDNRVILPLLEKERKELAFMLPLESLGEALNLLQDRLENMSADDREDSRAVAACRISGGELLDRPYIYVIGLADRHFGISLIESPVLNDHERLVYFDRSVGNVPLSEEKAAKHLEQYVTSLELSEVQEIHMGYCCFDTVKQEELSPSALFLNMREKYASGTEELPLVEYPRVVSEDTIVVCDSVWNPELSGLDDEEDGITAEGTVIEENDKEDGAEKYAKDASENHAENAAGNPEGNIEEDGHAGSSQKIRELSLQFSPSSLDTLLACPAKYNYQKNRRIPEEDYAQPDSSVWLGAADKGTYFHLVLQKYVETVFVGKDTVSPEPDKDLFEKVFKEATEQTLELVPIESPAAARQDQEDVKEAAVRYLQRLHREFSDPACPWHVLACEKKFGRDGEQGLQQDCEYIYYTEPDSPETMQMVENHDLFHLTFTGIIDRLDGYVDAGGTQHFRIVDYKTGTRKNFEKYKMEGKNRRKTTQHSIYRMYASRFGTVDAFEYHFPFEEEEESQVYSVREFEDLLHDDDDYIPMVLHALFVEGFYPPMVKTGGCNYCTYSDICLSRILKPEE